MPIYEYECYKCNEDFSIIQGINVPLSSTQCPKCGSNDIKKKVSVFSCALGNNSSSNPFKNSSSGGS